MYLLESTLCKKEYLTQLRSKFQNPFRIFSERVCGFTVGPFFSVAYHSPYEWNRRITAECNRAWGYVREQNGGCRIVFIRGKGDLSPFWFLLYSLICFVVFSYPLGLRPALFVLSAGTATIMCLASAFASLITEQGEAGFHEISRLLLHPEDYYG